MYSEGRHPFTYSADWIRSKAPCNLSRSDAAELKSLIAERCGIEGMQVAIIFSRQYQADAFQAIYSSASELSALEAQPTLADIRRAVMDHEVLSQEGAEQLDAFARVLHGCLARQSTSEMTLTQEQLDLLPDLVSFAMVGFGLLKNDPSIPESAARAINAFMPLVEEELTRRKDAAREESDLRWGF